MTIRIDVDAGDPVRMIHRAIIAVSAPNITDAVADAAKVYQSGIARRAPRRSGRLAGSYEIAILSATEAEASSGLIYAPVHEYGATIRARRAKVLRFTVGGQVVFARSVTIPARPYVAPTFAADSDKAFDAFADRIDRALT